MIEMVITEFIIIFKICLKSNENACGVRDLGTLQADSHGSWLDIHPLYVQYECQLPVVNQHDNMAHSCEVCFSMSWKWTK